VSAVVPALITAGACNVFSESLEARPVAMAEGNILLDDLPNETTSWPWKLETAG